jgi:hypothetical protein
MLNADRFLALCLGIKYYVRVTKTKIRFTLFLMPIIGALTSYLALYDKNNFLGILCASTTTWNDNSVRDIGKICIALSVISNVFFYIGTVAMFKTTLQRKTIVKISVITGSVLVSSSPGLIVFSFFPNSQDRTLYFYAVLPTIIKCILNPFLYIWRFVDCRYELKKVICFWKREEIETKRKNYFSSYTINANSVRHVDEQI